VCIWASKNTSARNVAESLHEKTSWTAMFWSIRQTVRPFLARSKPSPDVRRHSIAKTSYSVTSLLIPKRSRTNAKLARKFLLERYIELIILPLFGLFIGIIWDAEPFPFYFNPFPTIYTPKNAQVVTGLQASLFTSCWQVVFALLVPSCNKFGTSC
jgi:hypothetical protein